MSALDREQEDEHAVEGVERRDRGLARAALGRTDLACDDVQAYLKACRDAPDAAGLRRQLAGWRDRPPPPLH